MDSLIGLIIFLGILLLSVISRFAQQKQIEESHKKRRAVRPEELPEKTRRMIYGEGVSTARVREAVPKKTAGAAPSQRSLPPEARPIEVRDLMEALLGEKTARPGEAQSAPSRQEPPQVIRRTKEEVRRPQPVVASRTQPVEKAKTQEQHVQMRQPMPVAKVKPGIPPKERPRAPVSSKETKRGSSVQPQSVSGERGRTRRLIQSPAQLRYGIILSEILGPPKALRM
ncbi:MAG TPA: hypothetical protein PKY35_01505 [Candidatus Hydrogenedentes bacterium]|nr:hypothetical protein [Candidatus Hydrogenedentota bacterium]HOL75678.1 hypothetical protein [Candidatus Hydrogenedentota bacterium]HPO84329.1 hypothetical protein [Candidatus Hydrogenedentota bacterium]